MPRNVKTLLKSGAALSLAVLLTVVIGPRVVGQDQPAARGQGRGRGETPPPPQPQRGHPSGKLVIWGDMANFERPGVPNRCIAQSRYKRGARAGFRMTAIDGGTGEVENTAVLVVHLTYGGKTLDIPMRWRGNTPFPQQEYLRAPVE